MKSNYARLIIFFAVCVVLIASITAVTYAVWEENSDETNINISSGEWDDPSYRYLVLQIEYTDSGQTMYKDIRFNTDISAFDAQGVSVQSITAVKVVGYEGLLTTLKIPPRVLLKNTTPSEERELSLKVIAMQSVEMYDALRLVQVLEIPYSVTTIEAYSFAFCDSLREVNFVVDTLQEGQEIQKVAIGEKCFYMCRNAVINYNGRQ